MHHEEETAIRSASHLGGLVRTRTLNGARLLSDGLDPLDQFVLDAALHHHERWDGSGYPAEVSTGVDVDLEHVGSQAGLRGL